jgi:hypothetical protein
MLLMDIGSINLIIFISLILIILLIKLRTPFLSKSLVWNNQSHFFIILNLLVYICICGSCCLSTCAFWNIRISRIFWYLLYFRSVVRLQTYCLMHWFLYNLNILILRLYWFLLIFLNIQNFLLKILCLAIWETLKAASHLNFSIILLAWDYLIWVILLSIVLSIILCNLNTFLLQNFFLIDNDSLLLLNHFFIKSALQRFIT